MSEGEVKECPAPAHCRDCGYVELYMEKKE